MDIFRALTDSRLLTISGAVIDAADRTYWLRFRYANINDTGDTRNRLSRSAEIIKSIEGGATVPTRFGQIRGELRISDDQINTPQSGKENFSVEVAWRKRF